MVNPLYLIKNKAGKSIFTNARSKSVALRTAKDNLPGKVTQIYRYHKDGVTRTRLKLSHRKR